MKRSYIRNLLLLVLLPVLLLAGAYHFGPVSFFFSMITLVEVIVLFNILILVHELGHFLAAKWCGLKIEKFAIWMGKPLWSKKVDGVEYILGSIPAGGYVALPQMAPMEALEGKSDTPREEIPPATPGQKIIVAFAGPLFSFALALFFGCIVWAVGKPVAYSDATTTIGYVLPNNPAEKAGLKAGDKIVSIQGHEIQRFMGVGNSVIWRIITSTGEKVPFVVERDGKVETFQVEPQADIEKEHHWWQRTPNRKVGIGPADKEVVIKKLLADSPAEVAGLKPKDRILSIDGQPIYTSMAIQFWLKDHKDPVTFKIVRDGQEKEIVVPRFLPVVPKELPDGINPTYLLGIAECENWVTLAYPSPFLQVRESVDAVTNTISALVTPGSNVGASQLSGPVGIMNIFFVVLSSENGWRLALWLAVLINVNLAILNMFPLPVLDGGHITLSIIEWIRQRPLSMKILEPLQTGCAMLLIGYMIYITFFDLQDTGRMASTWNGELKYAKPAVATP